MVPLEHVGMCRQAGRGPSDGPTRCFSRWKISSIRAPASQGNEKGYDGTFTAACTEWSVMHGFMTIRILYI